MVSCALRLPPAVSSSGVRCGRACWAYLLAVRRPPWLGCRGVFFAFFFFALWCQLLGFPVPGLVVPVTRFPFSRAGLLAFFFLSWSVSACFGVPFPVGCCSWPALASFGLVVPLSLFSGPVFGALLGGGWPPLVVLAGGLAAVGCFFTPPPLPPPLFFFSGGGLPVPPSAFPGLAHALARIQCCFPGCCWRLRSVWPFSGPMGRVGYVHVRLGAPSCRVRSGLCLPGGCARRLRGGLG